MDAVLGEIYGGPQATLVDEPYEVPGNLQRFFAGKTAAASAEQASCCPPSEQESCCEPEAKEACCGASTSKAWLQMIATTGVSTVDATLLWQQLHDRLLGFIARRVARPEDAEDILQEVMLRVHRHVGDLEHAERVVGWVYRIASNAIVDHYRIAARRELPTGSGVDVLQPDPSSVSDVVAGVGEADPRSELAACLMPLLGSLSLRQREAIMLT